MGEEYKAVVEFETDDRNGPCRILLVSKKIGDIYPRLVGGKFDIFSIAESNFEAWEQDPTIEFRVVGGWLHKR